MTEMSEEGGPDTTLDKARRLRREMTQPERALWRELRQLRRLGYRFRRQAPIGPYIADFYEPARRLVIEIDGESHAERGDHDRRRDAWMEDRHIQVFRISNDDVVIADVGAVVEAIVNHRRAPPSG